MPLSCENNIKGLAMSTDITKYLPTVSQEEISEDLWMPPDEAADEAFQFQADELVKHADETRTLMMKSVDLQSLCADIQGSIPEGGLTVSEAKVAEVCAKEILNGTEVTIDCELAEGKSLDVSMENSSYLLEVLKRALESIWKAIKAAILQLRKMAIKIYYAVFSISARLQRRAQALLKQAAHLEGAEATGTIDISGDVHLLQIAGVFSPDIGTGLTGLNLVNRHLCFDHFLAAKATAGHIAAFVNEIDPSNDVVMERTSSGVKSIRPIHVTGADIDTASEVKDTVATRTPEFMGGKAIRVVKMDERAYARNYSKMSEAQFHVQQVLTKNDLGLITVTPFKSAGETVIEPLPVMGVIQALTQVIVGCDIIQNFKQSFSEREVLTDKLLAAGESYREKASRTTGLSDSNAWLAQALLQLPNIAVNLLEKPITPFVSHCANVFSASLRVCEKSLKAYPERF